MGGGTPFNGRGNTKSIPTLDRGRKIDGEGSTSLFLATAYRSCNDRERCLFNHGSFTKRRRDIFDDKRLFSMKPEPFHDKEKFAILIFAATIWIKLNGNSKSGLLIFFRQQQGSNFAHFCIFFLYPSTNFALRLISFENNIFRLYN